MMLPQKRLVVLSGAGMSAESGLKTFRDMGGLWEQYDVTEVASPQAWSANRALVLRFYNERRKKLLAAKPNPGHIGLVELENYFGVRIITQNIDDLHERAGSKNVLHLHGELRKARSTTDPSLVYEIEGWELKEGDTCEKGSQLRPHVVWFGEPVPAMDEAVSIVSSADILVIIGTSLNVYPAAELIHYAQRQAELFLIDPHPAPVSGRQKIEVIQNGAGEGVKKLLHRLIEK